MAKPSGARPFDASTLPADLPPLEVVYRPVEDLAGYEFNARTHSPEQLRMIASSMLTFGWTSPVLMDEQGIIAGHGRCDAARLIWGQGLDIPRCPRGQAPTITLTGLSPVQRRAYILADNQIPQKAGWDMGLLRTELADIRGAGFDLGIAGFEAAELAEIEAEDPNAGDTVGGTVGAGDLLALVNITIDEPEHKVAAGDHWLIGGRHRLFCCAVMDEWEAWAPHLVPGTIFAPYPGVFVVYGRRAEQHPVLLVQPDPYICGHILDQYERCFGEGSVVRVAGEEPAA